MTKDAAPKPFAMLGDPAAEVCEGDACLIPSERAVFTETPSASSFDRDAVGERNRIRR